MRLASRAVSYQCLAARVPHSMQEEGSRDPIREVFRLLESLDFERAEVASQQLSCAKRLALALRSLCTCESLYFSLSGQVHLERRLDATARELEACLSMPAPLAAVAGLGVATCTLTTVLPPLDCCSTSVTDAAGTPSDAAMLACSVAACTHGHCHGGRGTGHH